MLTIGELVHIDGTDNITMSCETALLTVPLSAFGLMSMAAYRTLARCSSFGASEAHDAGLLGFVGEVVDLLAVFPQGHALVMVPAAIAGLHPVRIANEERANLLLETEVDHSAGGFVPHVTHAALSAAERLVLAEEECPCW